MFSNLQNRRFLQIKSLIVLYPALTDTSWQLRNVIFREFPKFSKKIEVIRADDGDENLENPKSLFGFDSQELKPPGLTS